MRFGFLVFDHLDEPELLGPCELTGVWTDHAQGPSEHLLVGDRTNGIPCAKGLRLLPGVAHDNAGTLDGMFARGGMGSRPADGQSSGSCARMPCLRRCCRCAPGR